MSQATQVKTGRYSVGQELIAVAAIVAFPGLRGVAPLKRSRITVPVLWQLQEDGTKVTDFLFKTFTVTEHHRVPNEWDDKDKLTCDGYILQNGDGRVWHNQYPRASYGQVSDTADGVFTLDATDIEGASVKSIIDDWKNPWQWITVDRMLDGLTPSQREKKMVLDDLNSENPKQSQAAVAYLQQLYLQFLQAFERDMGSRFKIADVEIFPGYFRKKVVAK